MFRVLNFLPAYVGGRRRFYKVRGTSGTVSCMRNTLERGFSSRILTDITVGGIVSPVVNSEKTLLLGEIPAFIPQFNTYLQAGAWEGNPKDPFILRFAAMDPFDSADGKDIFDCLTHCGGQENRTAHSALLAWSLRHDGKEDRAG